MTTDIIIDQIRTHWWILLFIICMVSYFVYSFIKEAMELKAVKDRKKALEKELDGLKAQYNEEAKKLEGKMEERKKFYRGGKRQ